MSKFTREDFRDRLQNSWQFLIERYAALPPAEKASFLARQGYPALSGLLGHIIAWWQDGAQVVEAMRSDPTLPLPDYDVDSFNARAVERFSGQPEVQVLAQFETQRAAMLQLVNALSDAELAQSNINTRLYYEILMHWTEHDLS
jgi:hypothetical protein